MTTEDVVNTLTLENMIIFHEATPSVIKPAPGQSIKYPKGRKHGVSRRHTQRTRSQDKEKQASKGPYVPPKHYEIIWDTDEGLTFLRRYESRGLLKLKPEKLQWTPYLLTRSEQIGLGQLQPDPMEQESGALTRKASINSLVGSEPSIDDQISNSEGKDAEQEGERREEADEEREQEQDELPRVVRRTRKTASPEKSTQQTRTRDVLLDELDDSPKKRLRNWPRQLSASLTPVKETRPARNNRRFKTNPEKSTFPSIENEDMALLAIVASPERRQTRLLRSASGELGIPDPFNSSVHSPRKRRRVASHEHPLTAVTTSDCQSPGQQQGQQGCHQQHYHHTNNARLNGVDHKGGGIVMANALLESDAADTLLKLGAMGHLATPLGASVVHMVTVNGSGSKDVIIGRTQQYGQNRVEVEIKSEEGTPLTSLESRQSPRSEDTIYCTDGGGQTGLAQGGQEEDIDLDADGEYEEDVDGEGDVDMGEAL